MKILKYLHAADFQLHVPVTCWERLQNAGAAGNFVPNDSEDGLPLERISGGTFGTLFPEIPSEIAKECMSAAWESAGRVFDLAIEQNVDFVLLTGDILDPNLTGARGIVFLTEQFRRLHERGISVYWKLERSLEEWVLPDFHFPENVFLFPSNQPHIKKFRLPDSTKNVFIASWNARNPDFGMYDFSQLPEKKLPFSQTIAICEDAKALGCAEILNETEKEIVQISESLKIIPSYAALTSLKQRTTQTQAFSETETVFLHAPGTIQRRTPDFFRDSKNPNSASAGVSIIKQDLEGEKPVSVQFFPTETVGWKLIEKSVPEIIKNQDDFRKWLEKTLETEMKNTESAPCKRTLVFWRLHPSPLEPRDFLRKIYLESLQNPQHTEKRTSDSFLEEILNSIRKYGENIPSKPWSVALEITPENLIPYSWTQSSTILGDFLRLVEYHQTNPDADPQKDANKQFVPHTLELNGMQGDAPNQNILSILSILTKEEKAQLLKAAGVLGAEALFDAQEGPQK